MTLLDTEQSYVESLRTLMQVRWRGRGVTPQSSPNIPPVTPDRGSGGCATSWVAPGGCWGQREQDCDSSAKNGVLYELPPCPK